MEPSIQCLRIPQGYRYSTSCLRWSLRVTLGGSLTLEPGETPAETVCDRLPFALVGYAVWSPLRDSSYGSHVHYSPVLGGRTRNALVNGEGTGQEIVSKTFKFTLTTPRKLSINNTDQRNTIYLSRRVVSTTISVTL
jgi:hypothetical protein